MKNTLCWAVVFLFLLWALFLPGCILSAGGWTNTDGHISGYIAPYLLYDSSHNILYAGTDHGIWKYDGTTWTAVSDSGMGSGIAYDSGRNLLYATGTHGVYVYNGATWTNTNGEVSSFLVSSLAFDSAHNLLYAGTTVNGVWKYDGSTWTATNGEVASGGTQISLACDSAHNLLYAGTANSGVWKYNGTTWTTTGQEVSSYRIFSLDYDSAHKELYAGCSKPSWSIGYGVWKYDGKTWTDTGGGVSNYEIYSLEYDSVHNILYAGCSDELNSSDANDRGQGVWRYDGKTWTSTSGGLPSYEIASLAYDSIHNILYAGTGSYYKGSDEVVGNGVWKYGSF